MRVETIGNCRLFLGDCRDGMKDFPDKFFSLAIVDPPYGINAPKIQMGQNLTRKDGSTHKESAAVKNRLQRLNGGGGKLKNRILNTSVITWDDELPGSDYFDALFRVSDNQVVWGGNYFDLGPTRCVLCWNKCQPWENFSQWEMAWTSFDSPAALFTYSNTGGANKEEKIHPTQKPVALYEWILGRYGGGEGPIIDTHMGSGSSVIACINKGFEVYAWEKEQVYFDTACRRIEKAYHNRPRLFETIDKVKPIQQELF